MSSSQISDVAAIVEQHYFQSNPPPKGLEKHTSQAQDFISQHAAAGRRVVLVSSGGTTVPLGEQAPFNPVLPKSLTIPI